MQLKYYVNNLPAYAPVERRNLAIDGSGGAQTHVLTAGEPGISHLLLEFRLAGPNNITGYLVDTGGKELIGGAEAVIALQALLQFFAGGNNRFGVAATDAGQGIDFEQTSGTGDLLGYLVYARVPAAHL